MDRANSSERKKSNREKTELNQTRLKSNKTEAAQIGLGQKSKKVGKGRQESIRGKTFNKI